MNSTVRSNGKRGRSSRRREITIGQRAEHRAVQERLPLCCHRKTSTRLPLAGHHRLDLDVVSAFRHHPRVDFLLELHAEGLGTRAGRHAAHERREAIRLGVEQRDVALANVGQVVGGAARAGVRPRSGRGTDARSQRLPPSAVLSGESRAPLATEGSRAAPGNEQVAPVRPPERFRKIGARDCVSALASAVARSVPCASPRAFVAGWSVAACLALSGLLVRLRGRSRLAP